MANCDRKDCAARIPGATQAPQFGGYGCDPTVAQVTPKPYEPRFRKGDWVMWQGEPALPPWQAGRDDYAGWWRSIVRWTPRVGDVVNGEANNYSFVVGAVAGDKVCFSHVTNDDGKTWHDFRYSFDEYSISSIRPAPAPLWASWLAWQAESPADRFVREAKAAGAEDADVTQDRWRPSKTFISCLHWSDGLVTVSVHGLPPAAALEVIALANRLRGEGK